MYEISVLGLYQKILLYYCSLNICSVVVEVEFAKQRSQVFIKRHGKTQNTLWMWVPEGSYSVYECAVELCFV